MRTTMKMLLEALGFQVVLACSGDQAIQIDQEGNQDFGLVISDFKMPGLDGVETLKILGALHPGLKTILCSGSPEQECLRGRTLGHCTYLGKPFSLRDLETALDRVLG